MWVLFAVVGRIGGEARRGRVEDPRGDQDAVRRMAGRDADALAEIYDRHARAVYSLALRIVGEQAEAEDVVQEVFSQAWGQASKYVPDRGPVVAWLLTMARSRAIDRVRARRARPDAEGADPVQLAALTDSAQLQDLTLLTREQVGLLRTAMSQLPALQRVAIELAYFEGLTQTEIATRLDEPLGTVKTRVRLALLKLREALTESAR
jgi:RNA polymerase sigma-70 factor (ECF subfamily)